MFVNIYIRTTLINTVTPIFHFIVLAYTNGHCYVTDFGVDTLVKMATHCNFPWLMSNVVDQTTGEPLADGKTSHMITWHGKKVPVRDVHVGVG